MKYKFFPKADRQQEDIWFYTAEHWSEKQADRYIAGLHNAIKKSLHQKNLWQKIKVNGTEVYFIRYQSHYIFFRELNDQLIGIISILHKRMDILNRILDDLNLID